MGSRSGSERWSDVDTERERFSSLITPVKQVSKAAVNCWGGKKRAQLCRMPPNTLGNIAAGSRGIRLRIRFRYDMAG